MKTLIRIIAVAFMGYAIGALMSQPSAQQPERIYGSDSVTALPSGITTDGANALKVLGK